MARARASEDDPFELAAGAGGRAGAEITVRKLRAFWAVAHSESLTKAAKTLGVAQPTLSQQLTSLETALGVQLFERRSSRMELTETGAFLLRKSEHVLRSMQELEDGLALSGGGGRQVVRIAGVTSAVRALVPAAIQALEERHPGTEYDLLESAPAEILEMLYARRINLGLMSANSVAEVGAGFFRVRVLEDPHVLAVPEGLDLSGIADPERDLGPEAAATLGSTIQFVFGNQHSNRVQDWYDRHLPANRLRARVRSFELALDLVRTGLGVCIAPALSMLDGARSREGVRLYRINMEPRRIVAMLPSHCRRIPHYSDLLAELGAAGQRVALPRIEPMPPFLAAAEQVEHLAPIG